MPGLSACLSGSFSESKSFPESGNFRSGLPGKPRRRELTQMERNACQGLQNVVRIFFEVRLNDAFFL